MVYNYLLPFRPGPLWLAGERAGPVGAFCGKSW